jgi:hypothetical protein
VPKGGKSRNSGPKRNQGGDKRNQAAEKIRAQRAAEAQRRRRRNWLAGLGAAVVAAAVAIAVTLTSGGAAASGRGGTASGTGGTTTSNGGTAALSLAPLSTLGTLQPAPAAGAAGSEGVPVPGAASLAGLAASTAGQAIDGIGCQSSEQTLFHIHAHLTIFINGQPRQVPAGIGIPGAQATSTPNGPFVDTGTCFYWLHTHAADGIIHIESPVQRTYTLGDFFDEWGQPLGASQVGPAKGHVTAIYNGKVYRGDPRDIPLTAHAQIQLEVGTPLVAPVSVTFPNGL